MRKLRKIFKNTFFTEHLRTTASEKETAISIIAPSRYTDLVQSLASLSCFISIFVQFLANVSSK